MYSDLLEPQPQQKKKQHQPSITQRRAASTKALSDQRSNSEQPNVAQRQPNLQDNRLLHAANSPIQHHSEQSSQPQTPTTNVIQRAKVPDGFDPDAWESLPSHAQAVYKLIAQSPNFDILRHDMGENKLIAECANLGMALELAERSVKSLTDYATMVNKNAAKAKAVAKQAVGFGVGVGTSFGSMALKPVANGVGNHLAGYAIKQGISGTGVGVKKGSQWAAGKLASKKVGSEDMDIAENLRKNTGKAVHNRNSATEWVAEKAQDIRDDKYWVAAGFTPVLLTTLLTATTVLTGGLALIPGIALSGILAIAKAAVDVDSVDEVERKLVLQGETRLRSVLKDIGLAYVLFNNCRFGNEDKIIQVKNAMLSSHTIVQHAVDHICTQR
jgi:hypothetical protein